MLSIFTPPRRSVKLLNGIGSKAQYNGELARLGKRNGSWTTATTRSGKSVRWRSGHWENAREEYDELEAALDAALDPAEEVRLVQQSRADIESLHRQMVEAEAARHEQDRAKAVAQLARARVEAQARAAEIVDSVHATPPAVVAQHEGAHRSPFASLPEAVMVEMLQGMTTPEVCHVLQATRTLSALSRYAPFGECHLRDGLAAGDGVRPSQQFHFARRLGGARAALRCMHIDCGKAEVDVVRYLLQQCDTSRLTHVTIRIDGMKGQMSLGLVPDASSANPHDVDSDETLLLREATVGQVLGRFSEAIMPETARTLTGCLAQSCPNLCHLALIKQVDDVPSLASIKSLTSLEAHFLEADDINFILAELPRLRRLAVTGGNISSLSGERIDLESTSLEVIDLTAASKGLTFERIQCPTLRQIRCKEYGGYGNGLCVAFIPNVALGGYMTFWPWPWQYPHQHNLTELCVFGSLQGASATEEAPHAVIEIPAQCTITWDAGSYNGLPYSATTAMTLAEFAQQWNA